MTVGPTTLRGAETECHGVGAVLLNIDVVLDPVVRLSEVAPATESLDSDVVFETVVEEAVAMLDSIF